MQIGTNQVHEFLAGIFVLEKCTCKLRSGGHGILFLDATHGHAKVLSFNHNAYSKRVQNLPRPIQCMSLISLTPTRVLALEGLT